MTFEKTSVAQLNSVRLNFRYHFINKDEILNKMAMLNIFLNKLKWLIPLWGQISQPASEPVYSLAIYCIGSFLNLKIVYFTFTAKLRLPTFPFLRFLIIFLSAASFLYHVFPENGSLCYLCTVGQIDRQYSLKKCTLKEPFQLYKSFNKCRSCLYPTLCLALCHRSNLPFYQLYR